MPISFSRIPAGWKVPLFWAEVDPSMAGLPILCQPALITGTMFAAGEAEADVPIPVGSQAQADAYFGQGSEMSRMFKSFYKNNFANEVWGVGVKEPPASIKATATLKVAAVATDAGTIHLYVGGEHVPVNIGSNDTAGEIADAIAEAINDMPSLPVQATGPGGSPPPIGQEDSFDAQVTVAGDIDDGDYWLTIRQQQVRRAAAAGRPTTNGNGAPEQQPGEGEGQGGEGRPEDEGEQAPPAPPKRVEEDEVEITCRWAGVNGNDIKITTNYYGRAGGEVTPIGLNLELPPGGHLTGGVGVPDFGNAIMNLGETVFEYVALPYTDANTLRVWEEEYGFSDSGRWGWMRQLYGHLFSARRGIYGDLITFGSGSGRNAAQTSVMGVEPASPSPVFEWAAAYTAKSQRALTNDPAQPLQTLSLDGIKLAPLHERFNLPQVNGLAGHGIATQIASADNVTPMISRETTNYQLNLFGFEDDAYELVTTLATLARLLRSQRQAITSKYPRHKLANDGTRFGPGQAIVTPGIIKGELIAQYRDDEFNGLVEDTRNFKRHLLVERDSNDHNRVNVLYPPDLINQLRIFAVLAQFRLQYNRGLDVEVAAGVTTGQTGIFA
jgi:phage tail sheath gpL-like